MAYPERQPSGTVLHWREHSVAHIRFNRPKALNAIDTGMALGFLKACQDIAGDAGVRVVCLSAEGRAFMAGGDLAAMAADPVPVAEQLIAGMHGGLRLLAGINAPVVASVHGAVAGGGLGLVLACDMVIAAEGTRFGVAYPLIGASCDCSTSWSLPRVVGMHKAMELAILGNTLEAEEALRLGICNWVVPLASLEAETRKLVERVAAGPTVAYGHLRRLIRASQHSDLGTQLDAEAAGFKACAGTADFKEGVSAFLEKRGASFEGR